jgi:hypothetical protein
MSRTDQPMIAHSHLKYVTRADRPVDWLKLANSLGQVTSADSQRRSLSLAERFGVSALGGGR